MDQSTSPNAFFRLLDLPLEIRQQIYENALDDKPFPNKNTWCTALQINSDRKRVSYDVEMPYNTILFPALFLISRQVRVEALEVFLHTITIEFCVDFETTKFFKDVAQFFPILDFPIGRFHPTLDLLIGPFQSIPDFPFGRFRVGDMRNLKIEYGFFDVGPYYGPYIVKHFFAFNKIGKREMGSIKVEMFKRGCHSITENQAAWVAQSWSKLCSVTKRFYCTQTKHHLGEGQYPFTTSVVSIDASLKELIFEADSLFRRLNEHLRDNGKEFYGA